MASHDRLIRSTYQGAAATWPFTSISTILFGIKVFSRLCVQTDVLGWDDLVIAVSWILNITRAAVYQKSLISTRRITPTNLPETVPTATFWAVFTGAWSFLSIVLPKLGIGILIIRIFRPHHWLKVSIITLCASLNILAIVGFIITFVQCNPVPGQWDPFRHPQTRCWNRDVQIVYAITVSGISAFTDLAFSVYPSIIIWRLQMPTWKRISTMALMGLGYASFALAVVKLKANTTLLVESPDVNQILYHTIHICIWNGIENDFVLSAACLPSVPPTFRACKLFLNTHISSLSRRRTHRVSFNSLKLSSRSDRPDDTLAIELARNCEPPGTRETQSGVDYSGSE